VHLPGPLERPAGATAWRTPASRAGSCSVGTCRFPSLAGRRHGWAVPSWGSSSSAAPLCSVAAAGADSSAPSRRLLGRESGSCGAGGLLEPRADLADVVEQRTALPRIASVSARSLPTHASASSRRAAICSCERSSCSAASFCDPARISSASFVAFATCSSASALARSGWAPALTTMSAASAFVRAVISSASRRAPPVISSAVFRACWMMPFVCSLACSSACLTAASGERGRFELRDQAIDADDVGIDGRDRRRPRRRHRDAAGLSRRPAGGRPAEDAEEETEQPANGLRELAVVLEEASEELEDGDPRGPRRRGKDDDARRRGLMSEAFEHGGKARRPRDDAREFEVGFALTLLE
jgi:hypothetical protein